MKTELTCDGGCVMRGCRVVIPEKNISQVLEELHSQHFGIVRTKALARSYVWFPGIDAALESMIKSCATCQTAQPDPPTTCRPWLYPDVPWHRLHADFAYYQGVNFLIVIDSHSKWPEAIPMTSTSSSRLIQEFQRLFSTHGLPAVLVTDNGPQFVSQEFEDFLVKNGIRHYTSPHYHPSSNGQAERTVQTVKTMLKKIAADKGDFHRQLSNYLLTYRNTPHPTTGASPAELLMKRKLRTRLCLLKPTQADNIRMKQAENVRDRGRDFEPKSVVRVKSTNGIYELGKIVKKLSPQRYLVRVNGRIRYVHVDHIRHTEEVDDDVSYVPTLTPATMIPPNQPVRNPMTNSYTASQTVNASTPTTNSGTRNAAPPARYADYYM